MVKKAPAVSAGSVEAALRETNCWLKTKGYVGSVLSYTARRWVYGRPFWSVTVAGVQPPYGNTLTPRDIGLLIFDDGDIKVCYIVGDEVKEVDHAR